MADLKISQLTGATTPLAGTEVLPIVQSSATKKVAISDVTAGRSVSVGDLTLTTGGSVTNASEAYDYRYSSGGVGNNARVRYRTVYSGGGSGYGGSFELESRTSSNVWNTGAFIVTDDGNVSTTGNVIQGTAAKGINFTANTPAAGMTSQLLNWYEEGTWTPGQGSGLTVVGAFSSSGTYTRIGRQVTVRGQVVGATSVAVNAAGVISSNLPFTASVTHAGSMFDNAVTASGVVQITSASVVAATTIAATPNITFTATYTV